MADSFLPLGPRSSSSNILSGQPFYFSFGLPETSLGLLLPRFRLVTSSAFPPKGNFSKSKFFFPAELDEKHPFFFLRPGIFLTICVAFYFLATCLYIPFSPCHSLPNSTPCGSPPPITSPSLGVQLYEKFRYSAERCFLSPLFLVTLRTFERTRVLGGLLDSQSLRTFLGPR